AATGTLRKRIASRREELRRMAEEERRAQEARAEAARLAQEARAEAERLAQEARAEAERRQAEVIRAAVSDARRAIAAKDFEQAARASKTVLTIDPSHAEAKALASAAAEGLAEVHRRVEQEQRAAAAIAEARTLAGQGRHDAAIAALEGFGSGSARVASALAEIKAEAARLAQQRAAELARQEAARRAREQWIADRLQRAQSAH